MSTTIGGSSDIFDDVYHAQHNPGKYTSSTNDKLCNVTKDWLTGLLSHAEKAEAALPPLDNLTNKELVQRMELMALLGYIKSAEHILEMHDESK